MPHKIDKILAATSLAESSDPAVAAGRTLARACGAELHVLHAYVMPAMYYGSPMGMSAVYPYAAETERERVEQLLAAQLERLAISADEIAGKIFEVGTPHRLLVSAARDLSADLILVGASDTEGPLAPLLGSTADRVLRKAHVPVWVVRGRLELPLERVLAPTDLSELSNESLRHGLALLDQVAGERPRLETLFVLSHIERAGSVQFAPEQVERFARQELDRANQALEADTGWQAEGHVRTGLPRHEILAELEKEPADLIVVGTHGRSGFERLLMGSVAADVVRHAPASVLVVPPAEAREASQKSVH
jgi:nucleotide-binding universal stress UspA family protein